MSDFLGLGRKPKGLPATSPAPTLDGLPLSLDDAGVWWVLVRPSGSPTATARRLPVAGLSLTPIPAVRAA